MIIMESPIGKWLCIGLLSGCMFKKIYVPSLNGGKKVEIYIYRGKSTHRIIYFYCTGIKILQQTVE